MLCGFSVGHLPVLFSPGDSLNKPIHQSLSKPVRSLLNVRRNYCYLLLNKSSQTSMQDYPHASVSNSAGNNCVTKVFIVAYCRYWLPAFLVQASLQWLLLPPAIARRSSAQRLGGGVCRTLGEHLCIMYMCECKPVIPQRSKCWVSLLNTQAFPMTSSVSVQYSDKSLCQDQVAGAKHNHTLHDAIISSFLIPLPG